MIVGRRKPVEEIAKMIDEKVGKEIKTPAVILLAGCFLGCGPADGTFAHQVYEKMEKKGKITLVALKGEFSVTSEHGEVKGKIVRDPEKKRPQYKEYFNLSQQIKALNKEIDELEGKEKRLESQESDLTKKKNERKEKIKKKIR